MDRRLEQFPKQRPFFSRAARVYAPRWNTLRQRVVGLPGDTVELRHEQLIVNDSPGGLAYENFELIENFRDSQSFVFGVTRRSPQTS